MAEVPQLNPLSHRIDPVLACAEVMRSCEQCSQTPNRTVPTWKPNCECHSCVQTTRSIARSRAMYPT
eukprot:6755114-Prymnesium_polylepis.2